MDSSVFRQGETINLVIPASSQIAVWTNGKAYVYQRNQTGGGPMGPKVLLATVLAGTPYQSGVLSSTVTTLIEIDNQTEDPVRYQIGTSALPLAAVDGGYQGAPGTLNATGTLTIALLLKRIVTSTTAAGTVATLDTGAVIDAAFQNALGVVGINIGDSIDWTIVNTGPSTFTVTASAGHTLEGVGAVLTLISSTWRTRKTAAATYVSTRLC